MDPMILPNVAFANKFTMRVGFPSRQFINVEYAKNSAFRQLIWEIASNNPLWTVLISRASYSALQSDHPAAQQGKTHYAIVRAITIEHNGEELGEISINYSGDTEKFYIDNHRIAKERTGRNAGRMVTGDVKRAYREIKKNFYKLDMLELIKHAAVKLERQFDEAARPRVRNVYAAKTQKEQAATAFITEHPELITNYPFPDPNKDIFIAQTEEHKKASEAHQEVLAMKANPNRAVVIVHGSSYVLSYNGETTTIPSEELPMELKANLGWLKLSEDETLIPNVGLKVGNVFFVLPEGEK
jgi:hypothetical protein